MRVLAEGSTHRPLVAVACLAGGLGLLLVGFVLAVAGAVS
jgi:hypothetical protein